MRLSILFVELISKTVLAPVIKAAEFESSVILSCNSQNGSKMEVSPTLSRFAIQIVLCQCRLLSHILTRVISNIVAASTLSLPCQKVLYSSTKKELSRIIITQWLRPPKARLLFDEIGEDPFNRVIADTKDLIINHFPTDKQKQYLDELMKVEYTEDLKKSLELDLTTSEDYILVHLRWHILGAKNFSILRSFYLF